MAAGIAALEELAAADIYTRLEQLGEQLETGMKKAAASAGVYLNRGYIDPGLAMPVMLGVLAGSVLGTRILMKAETNWLRLVFSVVIVVLGLEMIYKGLSGRI